MYVITRCIGWKSVKKDDWIFGQIKVEIRVQMVTGFFDVIFDAVLSAPKGEDF
jgi:hypothetical protein